MNPSFTLRNCKAREPGFGRHFAGVPEGPKDIIWLDLVWGSKGWDQSWFWILCFSPFRFRATLEFLLSVFGKKDGKAPNSFFFPFWSNPTDGLCCSSSPSTNGILLSKRLDSREPSLPNAFFQNSSSTVKPRANGIRRCFWEREDNCLAVWLCSKSSVDSPNLSCPLAIVPCLWTLR